jgi:predicted DNA-binding protein (UPF0251 family)
MGYAEPRQASLSDDDLLAAVVSLPRKRRWRHFDRLAGRPEVAAVGFRVSERRLSPRRNTDRDEEWTRLHDEEGLSYGDIAHAVGVARDTVAKAVQRFRQRVDSESPSIAARG